MTPEQLTLARQFCEAVGWETSSVYVELHCWPPSEKRWTPCSWLFTGDGMLAVKAEMAKRGKRIYSGPGEVDGTWKAWIDLSGMFYSDGEPAAVLACATIAAVAAMKAKGVPSE